MLHTLDVDPDEKGYCWRCANIIMRKYREIEKRAGGDPLYRQKLKKIHATV
jgi:hypothetical protein